MFDRFSDAWIRHRENTGDWLAQPYWREPGYLQGSPWSLDELDAAFAAAGLVFTPGETQKLYKAHRGQNPAPHHLGLLHDVDSPRRSQLLALGLDLAQLGATVPTGMLRRLRNEDDYPGARFELALLVAFRRAGLHVDFEPKLTKGRNPDFLLHIGTGIAMDAKFALHSKWNEEEDLWFDTITCSAPGMHNLDIEHEISYTPEMLQALQSETGRSRIRNSFRSLGVQVRQCLREALSNQAWPLDVEIEGLVRVRASGPAPASGRVASFRGNEPDEEREALRLIGNLVVSGAGQLPSILPGILAVETGDDVSLDCLARTMDDWLRQPEGGALYPQLSAVLLVYPLRIPGASVRGRRLVVVPAPSCPSQVTVDVPWGAIAEEFNWRGIREVRWAASRRSATQSQDQPSRD